MCLLVRVCGYAEHASGPGAWAMLTVKPQGPMPVYQNTPLRTHQRRSVDKRERERERYCQTPNRENRKPAIAEVGSFH